VAQLAIEVVDQRLQVGKWRLLQHAGAQGAVLFGRSQQPQVGAAIQRAGDLGKVQPHRDRGAVALKFCRIVGGIGAGVAIIADDHHPAGG
jgi:hypothetical protein